jgi:general stress protein 26
MTEERNVPSRQSPFARKDPIVPHAEETKKLAEMVKDIDICMLTTAEPDGTLRSRPMSTQQAEFDGDLWFLTYADSPKVDEIEADRQVNVSYVDRKHDRYVSVSGTATLVRDRAKIHELWQPIHKAWFTDGKDDPNLAALKVRAEQAEYWDAKSSKMVQAFGLAKALVTGQEFEPGENEKLDLAS